MTTMRTAKKRSTTTQCKRGASCVHAIHRSTGSHGRPLRIRVKPSGDRWVVMRSGQRSAYSFSTQAESIQCAKRLARDEDGILIVHGRDGDIRKVSVLRHRDSRSGSRLLRAPVEHRFSTEQVRKAILTARSDD